MKTKTMLRLKIGESFSIGHEVDMTLLCKKGRQVKFAIQAPKKIAICRAEIGQRAVLEKPTSTMMKRYKTDNELIDALYRGDKWAEFKIGKIMFAQERYGLAQYFLNSAFQKGIAEAKVFLGKIDHLK